MKVKVRTTLPRTQIINEIEKYIRQTLAKDPTGHDWHHVERVRTIAVRIAQEEGIDIFLVEVIALLHELPDRKIAGEGNEKKALMRLRKKLAAYNLPDDQIDEILYVIENQSYSKSGLRGEKLESPAGRIVQDADRLDALGAIGIARCFAYGATRDRSLHDPASNPKTTISEHEHTAYRSTSINHFYEKLLKLKNLMNTKTARKIAEGRHRFIEKYLEQFLAEWEGRK